MEEINTKVAELTVLYKLFNEKPNKKTSISLRKSLMELKNTSHALRKDVLVKLKPVVQVKPAEVQLEPVAQVQLEPLVEPVASEAPVEQVEPPVKKTKRSKSSKKEKQKIKKEKATTVKFN